MDMNLLSNLKDGCDSTVREEFAERLLNKINKDSKLYDLIRELLIETLQDYNTI